jgi:hypothetical protein
MSALSCLSMWQFSVLLYVITNSSNWNLAPCAVSCAECVLQTLDRMHSEHETAP